MPTDYADIYDRVIADNPGYQFAEGSPGYAAVLRHRDRLSAVKGRSLDVGCGVGFALCALRSPLFCFDAFGCDISPSAVESARSRVGDDHVERIGEGGRLPYDDDSFDLVTCFDVLEHLDEIDLPRLRDEMTRVRKPSGVALYTVSLRPAASGDHHGDNLHRTVMPIQWWIDLLDPTETIIDHPLQQATMWLFPTDLP